MGKRFAFTKNSRAKELQVQRRLQDVIAAKFKRRIAAEVKRESLRLAGAFRETGVLPADTDSHVQQLQQVYLQMAEVSIRTFGNRVNRQAKSIGREIETKEFSFEEFFNQIAIAFIQQEAIRQRIIAVSATTRNQISAQIEAGYQAGLGVDAIARLIVERAPDLSRVRAATIARTETHGAANYGADAAARATGLDLNKEWLSGHDQRTRDHGQSDGVVDEFDHRSMDGQTVGMDEKFRMPWKRGGFVLCNHPGDISLPPGAIINCRCSVVHTVEGFDDD